MAILHFELSLDLELANLAKSSRGPFKEKASRTPQRMCVIRLIRLQRNARITRRPQMLYKQPLREKWTWQLSDMI
jgi:hypothetical protein